MIKILCFCFFTIPVTLVAQWSGTNPVYFNAGNVGIGTSSPADQLEIVNGYRKIGFNTPVSGVSPGGILSLSRPDDGTKILLLGGAASPNDDQVILGIGGSAEMRFVSAGGSSAGFGFYTNISAQSAFGSARPTPIMKITGEGNVGLGIPAPLTKLHVGIDGSATTSYGSISTADIGLILQNKNNTNNNFNIISFSDAAAWGIAHIGTITNHTNHSGKLFLSTRSSGSGLVQRMLIDENGNVGIGTTTPSRQLHVNGSSEANIRLQSPTAIWDIQSDAFTYGNFGILNYSSGSADASRSFLMNGSNGYVGIGTSTPDQKLTVNGTIHSKEVKVDLSVPAPDYVFGKDYNLPSLDSIKTYIDQNKHLPEVPSAKEMEANGVNLGNMNMLLLKKIEEMTLYMIDQQKQIDELKLKIK